MSPRPRYTAVPRLQGPPTLTPTHVHATLRLNTAKTATWNAAGRAPLGCADLAPEARVWLGVPVGHSDFVEHYLQCLQCGLQRHSVLPQHVPAVDDVQMAWLLLSACAVPRAQYAFRTVPPPRTQDFAAGPKGHFCTPADRYIPATLLHVFLATLRLQSSSAPWPRSLATPPQRPACQHSPPGSWPARRLTGE